MTIYGGWKYRPQWDLATIPDTIWASEQGRRSRAKGPAATNIKLEPCKGCQKPLTARERRKACPHCGISQRTFMMKAIKKEFLKVVKKELEKEAQGA